MNNENFFIKIQNNNIRDKLNFKTLIYAYLFFHKDYQDIALTSIEYLMKYFYPYKDIASVMRHPNRGLVLNFRNALTELEKDNFIKFIPYNENTSIEQINLKSMMKLKINTSFIEDVKTNFTTLDIKDFDTFIVCATLDQIDICKLLSIYLFIKSYLFNNNSVCSLSLLNISKTLHIHKDAVKMILEYLAKLKVIRIWYTDPQFSGVCLVTNEMKYNTTYYYSYYDNIDTKIIEDKIRHLQYELYSLNNSHNQYID